MIVLGLSVVTGGPPEFESRIAKAWSAFYAHGARQTSEYLSLGTQRERWLRPFSPVLAFGCWGWLWSAPTRGAEWARTSIA